MQRGESGAEERLFSLVYDRLRRLAASYMRHDAAVLTLQPTAVVHEAYIRLRRTNGSAWEGRSHFLGVAARAIRHVLVDAARRRNAAKRGAGGRGVTLVEGLAADIGRDESSSYDVLDVNAALEELAAKDARLAQVTEMRFFGGMTVAETAEALACSKTTVKADWATARTWLARRLDAGEMPA